ncbi:MAG: DHHA1 domain-containing protein [Oscillospiraceae bacterium]|nr:DHHA1 domain-containing protein [Oscillospiraceae bacterium]
MSISGVDASFVLYEYDGGVSFSARSMGALNVQIIMEKLGGGGHHTMAGSQIEGINMEDARQKLLEAIDCYYDEKNGIN